MIEEVKMKKIMVTIILVVLIVIGVVANVAVAKTSTIVSAASDKVTAPDPNWPSPAELEKGRIAFEQMLEQNK